jgi:DNA polymerase-3 subunit delta
MTEQVFFSLMAKNQLSGAYLLYGLEPYSRLAALKRLALTIDEAARELNVTTLKAPALADAVNACESLPFFAQRRLVILRDLDGDTADGLGDYLKSLPSTTLLILDRPGEGEKTGKLFKALNKEDRCVEFAPFDEGRAADFVEKRARENGIPMDRLVARKLVSCLGTDLGGLENALLMLGDYAGKGNPVTVQAVDVCITPSPDFQIFSILDALVAGNKKPAVSQLAGMLKTGADTSMRLASFFEGRIKQMLIARQMLTAREPREAILRALGGSPYAAKKTIQNAEKCTLSQLVSALAAFSRVDSLQKQGLMKDDDALLLAIFQNF